MTSPRYNIFTPPKIAEFMASKLHKGGTLLEPCVGTGDLLRFVNTENYEIDAYDINVEFLNLITNKNIRKYNCDFLFADIEITYQNIIINPPYIRIQNLGTDYKKKIKSAFPLLSRGSIDIYYAFIIRCLNLLDENGVMVAIIPNSYLYNKSASKLHKYLFDNRFIKKIIDFGEKKVFPNVSVYCCITIFTKTYKEALKYNNTLIKYNTFHNTIFSMGNNSASIREVCKITNGIATLRDKIFIYGEPLFDEPCWMPITNGPKIKYIIYPYSNGAIIGEDEFKRANPITYNYLLEHKSELLERDKGKGKYPVWYAYGRAQSLLPSKSDCIFISSFIHPNNILKKIYIRKPILHYNCLKIEPISTKYIKIIINSIKKNIHQINDNSPKRSNGWINLSNRILYQLPL